MWHTDRRTPHDDGILLVFFLLFTVYMCVLMCNFVCVILCNFVFLCDILLPSGVINDDDDDRPRLRIASRGKK